MCVEWNTLEYKGNKTWINRSPWVNCCIPKISIHLFHVIQHQVGYWSSRDQKPPIQKSFCKISKKKRSQLALSVVKFWSHAKYLFFTMYKLSVQWVSMHSNSNNNNTINWQMREITNHILWDQRSTELCFEYPFQACS